VNEILNGSVIELDTPSTTNWVAVLKRYFNKGYEDDGFRVELTRLERIE
jgi:hypothetical protein